MKRVIIRVLLGSIVLGLAPGCMTISASFPDYAAEEVWTAALTVAEQPEYCDWVLAGNDVWIDPDSNRIEIERRLKRDLHRPGLKPLYQDRRYRFSITLTELRPPTVRFKSHDFNIPMHLRVEAERYFRDMRLLLAGEIPVPAAPDSPPPAAPPPTQPPGDLERIGPEDVGRPGGR